MINRVVLIGRLTKDIELRYTQNGTAVGSFSLAVNRQFTNSAGEREADFINAIIWRKSAENLANFTHKGSLIGIEGRLQTRNYENQQGTRVYVTEVIVDNFSLLESRGDNDGKQNNFGNTQGTQFGQGTGATAFGQAQSNNQAQPQQNFGGGQPVANNATANPGATGTFGGSSFGSAANSVSNSFAANGQEIEINDDDLPF